MTFCFPQYFTQRTRFLAYTVVAKALTLAGHVLTEHVDDCDAVLFSMCDVMEYPSLVRMKKFAGHKPLIVGGSYAYHFRSAILYCDAVWVGECYEMAECRTLNELMSHPSCYCGGDKLPKASTRIDWEKVPVSQIAPKKAYYWGGQGCKNKCKFCLTSWTHPHQVNSQARITAAKKKAADHGLHLMVCANEYSKGDGGTTQDMLLKDYLIHPVSRGFVRIGVEFATEETRGRCGKPITDEQLAKAISKMSKENISLRLFHISGYNTKEEWEEYVERMASVLDRYRPGRLLHLMFNNLQYQNYTPLYMERKNIDPSRYLDLNDTKRYYNRLRAASPHVLVGAPSPFAHVAARMGTELATEKAQVDYWRKLLRTPAAKMNPEKIYRDLFHTGVMDTPALRMDFRTGQIMEVSQDGGTTPSAGGN